MFVLYQSGGIILACAEEIDGCLEEFEGYLNNHPAPMAEDGRPLGIEDYLDFTMVQTPGLEVPGELYVRRCTLALFEASIDHNVAVLPYVVGALGIVSLNTGKD